MVALKRITQGCYVLILVSIVVSTACAIYGVWVDAAADVAWRGVATGGILLAAACFTAWANSVIEQHANGTGFFEQNRFGRRGFVAQQPRPTDLERPSQEQAGS